VLALRAIDLSDAEPYVLEVLRSGHIAQGPMVQRLERSFAELLGVRHAVAVNNGTAALIAALQVLDLRPGDEVITSPFTFVATLNAILVAGGTARFADITEGDFAVDPARVTALVGERTRVLLPVHLYGQTADMGPLVRLATDHRLDIVEDAAQAHGATYRGRSAGTFGIGAFSFYATKNVTTGEGGMVTTDDDAVADRLRLLRNQGMRSPYQYEMVGHNYRMTDLQAAVGMPQIARIHSIAERQQRNAEVLGAALADVAGLRLPRACPGRGHVWHQYTVLLDEGVDRDRVVSALARAGIGTGIYYPRAVFDHAVFRDHPRVVADPVPVARSVAARCLSIPVHQALRPEELHRIADGLRCAVAGAA
jgi:dTDP-4-amino-4,6-dideoxygalactose transaminase